MQVCDRGCLACGTRDCAQLQFSLAVRRLHYTHALHACDIPWRLACIDHAFSCTCPAVEICCSWIIAFFFARRARRQIRISRNRGIHKRRSVLQASALSRALTSGRSLRDVNNQPTAAELYKIRKVRLSIVLVAASEADFRRSYAAVHSRRLSAIAGWLARQLHVLLEILRADSAVFQAWLASLGETIFAPVRRT